MKRVLVFIMALLTLGGCAALPGEERSFAVVLGIGREGGEWQAGARIPSYQAQGEYLSLTAHGETLGEAMASLNASAPMELHYGQLRLLLFTAETAQSPDFPQVVEALASRGEIRPQTAVGITGHSLLSVLDALTPATGSRLSKSLEAMMEARHRQGVLPSTTLEQMLRMGERQQPVLLNLELKEEQAEFTGGWLISSHGNAHRKLTSEEMQVLSLAQGQLRQGTLSLPEGTVTLLDAACRTQWQQGEAFGRLRLRYAASNLTEEGVQQALLRRLQGLTDSLAAAGCDALGLGRQVMMGIPTLNAWHQANWPEAYPRLKWQWDVQVERGA